MTDQTVLFPASGRCGYCGCELIEQPEIQPGWSCPRCAPLLTQVMTVEQWAAFQWAARRAWVGSR